MQAHILGYPRIGGGRALKRALEAYWAGHTAATDLLAAAQDIRTAAWSAQRRAGLDFVAVGDFSLYDHVLDTTCLLGTSPARFGAPVRAADLPRYFELARGSRTQPALELTKWFDTNYHYLVPEFSRGTGFDPDCSALLAQVREARELGVAVKPVLVGPLTYLYLGKTVERAFDRLELLPELAAAYRAILGELRRAGAEWVQVDEPVLALDLDRQWGRALQETYADLGTAGPRLLLATYFGSVAHRADALKRLPVAGLHLDLVRAPEQLEHFLPQFPSDKVLSLGVVDGRNVWRADLDAALAQLLRARAAVGERLWVGASCSLIHCPLDVNLETGIDPQVRQWLAFAEQKLAEIAVLKRGVRDGAAAIAAELDSSRAGKASRAASPLVHNDAVRQRVAGLGAQPAARRSPYAVRREAQRAALRLPLLPTTTIGSFPQTAEIRRIRAQAKWGEIDADTYATRIRAAIDEAIRFQLEVGLDVLVHGEPERNDMVEYFGEHLAGVAISGHGWVQSYGSRCVKPPIVYGDVSRPRPITVDWIRYAQSLTDKPVKGMLTGPVTILQWSFVRDDQPRSATALQLALAIRDEVLDLERAGIRAIQIDEPALREGLPISKAAQRDYLEWAGHAFRLTASGARDQTQIHTHMCYAEFEDILDGIIALDADVLTIETARSRMVLLQRFAQVEYPNEIGPGVYDVHSPHAPTCAAVAELLREAAGVIPAERLWVNPDCGLKTRSWTEVAPALRNMVAAARAVRAELERQAISARP